MPVTRVRITRMLTGLAAVIGVLVAVAFPVTYFAAAYSGLSATLDARAEGFAVAVNRLVSAAPDVWQYQHYRLEVQLQRLVAPLSTEQARIYDRHGHVLVEVGDPVPQPAMIRSTLLYDAGTPVGSVEVSDTLRGLLWKTLAAAVAGLMLAASVFFTLRSLPLRALERALEEGEARRAMLMEAERIARMGSWEYVPATGRLTWSEHLVQLLGLRAPPTGRARTAWARVHRDDRRAVYDAVRRWWSGASPRNVEFRVRVAYGDERIMLAQCEITRGADGAVTELRGTVLDITEQKRVQQEISRLNDRLDQRVRERTRELRRIVDELEAFSYSVAHDLRAPIRSIHNYIHLLVRTPGTSLDAAAARYAERIIAAASRMAALIDGLLDLARVNRVELRLATVDSSAMARTLIAQIAGAEPGRALRFEADEGVTVTADPVLLRRVLAHLLENAWKFTSGAPVAHIELRGYRDDGRAGFVVRDNGAGFDMRYAHKLFGTFQRLHAEDQYPGAGIGLVMVHRIVTRHGGSVRVDSAIGKGTAVYVTV